MTLNLPILEQLAGSRSILIAGMGGGFDVFCGLPLYFDLRERGFTVHLANYSFSDIRGLASGRRLSSTCVGVTDEETLPHPYFPERYLSQWLRLTTGEETPVWSFEKTGVEPLAGDYERLIDHLNIDAILLVDGGVDSLVVGDEAEMGTAAEDAVSLCAVRRQTSVKTKLIVCLGLGAERDLTYEHVFGNMADLWKSGAALGVCALVPQMPSVQRYLEAVEFVQSHPYHDSSVINSCIVSAVRGEFGDYHLTKKTLGSKLWISPLMTLCWFFDLEGVAAKSRLLAVIDGTFTFRDALMKILTELPAARRPKRAVPL